MEIGRKVERKITRRKKDKMAQAGRDKEEILEWRKIRRKLGKSRKRI